MSWPNELERDWQLLLDDLADASHGFFLIEYDRPFTREALLRRLGAEFERRDWSLLRLSLTAGRLTTQLERSLQELPTKAALVRLDSATARHFQALNLARERLYALNTVIIFLASKEMHTSLLTSARDLATWIAPPYNFSLPETGLPTLPPPASQVTPDRVAQIEYYREQVQQTLDASNRARAFELLPALADLYLSAAMHTTAHQIYRSLAHYHEVGANEQQAIRFTWRGDAVQGWRILAELQAGRISADDRILLQRLLDERLFTVQSSPRGETIADEMGRSQLLAPELSLALKTLSEGVAMGEWDVLKLDQILVSYFDESELRTLCFDLNVDYESLPGDGKADKAREFIRYLERRKLISDLVKVGKRLRPQASWEEAFKPPPEKFIRDESIAPTRTEELSTAAGVQHTSWQRALNMARRTLATLEEQAADYTALTIPTSLVNEIETKRQEITYLESLLTDVSHLPHNTLPRRVSFFGREKEIARALEALSPRDQGWGLMIDGIGGIGKTALAVEVAYQCLEQTRFDAFFFTTAKLTRLAPGGEQATEDAAHTLDAMLNEIAHAMDCQGVAQQTGADKRRALLDELRRFSGPERRVLLILDNLETLPSGELGPLFEFLRRLPQHCKAIVTSRRRAGEGAVWLRLEKLDWEPARDLIADRMGRASRLERTLTQAGESRWQELYDATGGSPLALRWSLSLMSARNLSLDRALALLRSGADDDSPLHQFIYREARQDMGADDWRVLGALSLFAAPASFSALTDTTDLTRLMLESALERLDAYALVDTAGPDGPYSLHPLTRQLAAGELATQPELGDTLRGRFARYWMGFAQRYGGGSKNYQTFHHLDAEWPNLEAAAEILRNQISEDNEKTARMLNGLVRALRTFLRFQGYWEEQSRLGEAAYRVMVVLEDWRNAGWRAYDVAWIHSIYARNEPDLAAVWVDRCAKAWERGGSRRDQAFATRMRGLAARQCSDLDKAERLLTEALAAYHDLRAKANQAIVLNDLGGVTRALQDYDRAEGYYRDALALAEKVGNKEYQASYISNLGNLALDRGRPDEARRWLECALPLAQEVGRQALIARSQWGLARVLEEDGHPADALPLAQAALQIYERLRHKDLKEARQLVTRLRKQIGKTPA